MGIGKVPRREIEIALARLEAYEQNDQSIPVETVFAEWRKDPAHRAECEEIEHEFELMGALMEARGKQNLSQAEIARRMGTSQSAVARLEGGRSNPSLATLRRYAAATGTRLKISFEPLRKD